MRRARGADRRAPSFPRRCARGTKGGMRSRRPCRPIAATLVAAITFGSVASLSAAPPDKASCVAAYESEQTARKDGKLREAREKALYCAQAACPTSLRDQCAQWLAEIDQSMPTVVFVVTDDAGNDLTDVEVWVDGAKLTDKLDGKAIALDPGRHALKFVSEAAPAIEQSIIVREGEKNRELKVKLVTVKPAEPKEPVTPKEPTEPPKPKEPPVDEPPKPPTELPRERPTPGSVYALGITGVVGLGVFTTFAILGIQNKTSLDNRGCRPNCPQGDVDTIKKQFLIGDIGLAVGVVSLGTAAVLYFTRGEEPAAAPKAGWTWQLAPTRTGAMGALQLTF